MNTKRLNPYPYLDFYHDGIIETSSQIPVSILDPDDTIPEANAVLVASGSSQAWMTHCINVTSSGATWAGQFTTTIATFRIMQLFELSPLTPVTVKSPSETYYR
jgi:hypothetical protein